ncbi:hypothetical protein FCL40_15460 [Ferrimonas sediminicola]|uniref:Uncharacterized protein n=1 Tax=Ferrimonas sediminicola TaxID=2569538 RepID=A0A4U1B9Y6_9GAMM|nr:hypothetical protein [Ferrimonas sediminicola]TKB47609.1 hypothetical protein FCL40_15460 [Ferrimonas sediminicola]
MFRNASRKNRLWLTMLLTLLTLSLVQPARALPAHRMPAGEPLACTTVMHHTDASPCDQCQSGCVLVAAAVLLPVGISPLPCSGSIPPPFQLPAEYPTPPLRRLRPPIS